MNRVGLLLAALLLLVLTPVTAESTTTSASNSTSTSIPLRDLAVTSTATVIIPKTKVEVTICTPFCEAIDADRKCKSVHGCGYALVTSTPPETEKLPLWFKYVFSAVMGLLSLVFILIVYEEYKAGKL